MSIEQLRPVLFIALCLVLLLMWQAWQRDYGARSDGQGQVTEAPAPSVSPDQGAAGSAAPAPDVPGAAPDAAAGTTPAADTPSATLVKEPGVSVAGEASGDAVRVTTDVVDVEISLTGGTITRLRLAQYPVSVDEPDTPFTLLGTEPGKVFVAQSGLIGPESAPNHHAPYQAAAREYRLADGADELVVDLVWNGGDVNVTKRYRFRRDSYRVRVEHLVENRGSTAWTGRMYGQFRRSAPQESRGLGTIYTYTGGVVSSPDKPYEKIDFDDMEGRDLERDIQGGWAAMIQHYFAGAWIPATDQVAHYYTKAFEGLQFGIGLVAPSVQVAPGASDTIGLDLYIGPKIRKRLEAAAPGLSRTVDYGWLFFIAEPLYFCLQFIHGMLGNWGWSIILLTVLIKLAFFPLSNASYKSMARMRKLQPRMQSLKERFGDDRQKLNQAMMDMYKKEKINPLGGCLPIVVQIPVFIALYWVLLETVELRHAPFMFWLDDLSTHDPFYVLPVAMGISMFAQQRLSPAPPDPIQAKVMMALPIVFTFFFLFFPSGLVLYWLVNNLLSISQQWVITRKIESGEMK